MNQKINRRKFIETTAATSAFAIVPRHVLGGAGYVAPNDKITLAHIGMGTQGFNELGGLLEDPAIQIVAVCDPNKFSDDYVEWGKHSIRNRIRGYLNDPAWREGKGGCPGGRDIGKQVVETYYASQRAKEKFNGCAAYADFRELLEKEKDLDAVKIMTPDHLHATISIASMKQGRHALMHKPVANRLYEGRRVLETARETGLATHLLAYGSGAANGMIVEAIQQGAIGSLREIHNWTNRPVWPQYEQIPKEKPPIPDGFDWELWLGPEKDRPYHPRYTHTVFRGWYDFGGGSMADMGIYSLWPVFTGLGLGAPLSARAWKTHACAIVDQVSRPIDNDFSYPTACSIRFEFAARDNMPAMDLYWHDGGMKPRLPDEVEKRDVEMEREGILFVGDDGTILAGFHGQDPKLFPKNGSNPRPLELPDREGERGDRTRRHQSWVKAVQGGEPSPGSFLNAGAITDAVNLGTVALRAGRKVRFDGDNMTITNDADATKYLFRDYRKGWEL